MTFTRHLAGDPERILELAVDYMGLGAWEDALRVLARGYPAGEGVVSEPGTPAPHEYPLLAYYRGYCREQSGDRAGAVADYSLAASLPARYVFPNRPESQPVLRRAKDVNPADATARLLLGSLLLAGGDVDGAIAEWEEVRRLAPRTPVLHRNLGLALLHGRGDPAAALAVLREGLAVDPRNPGLYYAAEQAQGLLGRPAGERLALLSRWPDAAPAPPALALARALTLVELGRFDDAEAAFRGRYFPREERGTTVREVWIEVRLRRALALAADGRAGEAGSVLDTLAQPAEGLAFTQGGLAPVVLAPRAQLLAGDAWAAAGDAARARECWRRATSGAGTEGLALEALARQRLGEEWDGTRAEAALTEGESALESGADLPGTDLWAQALLLRALGRESEARERLRRVFYRPDRHLSHFLARVMSARPPR
jgi:tetratricopeptide (TPR) repeat protein